MSTTLLPAAPADEPLTAADRAALERALAEPGIAVTVEALEDLVRYADDEVRALVAAGQVREAIAVARFNRIETTYNWDQPYRYYPEPFDDEGAPGAGLDGTTHPAPLRRSERLHAHQSGGDRWSQRSMACPALIRRARFIVPREPAPRLGCACGSVVVLLPCVRE